MKTIWKYQIDHKEVVSLNIPKYARILTLQVQHGNPVIWAMVDDEQAEREWRVFRIYETGHPIDREDKLIYIGTFQVNDGQYVFHLFEVL